LWNHLNNPRFFTCHIIQRIITVITNPAIGPSLEAVTSLLILYILIYTWVSEYYLPVTFCIKLFCTLCLSCKGTTYSVFDIVAPRNLLERTYQSMKFYYVVLRISPFSISFISPYSFSNFWFSSCIQRCFN